MGIMPRSHPIPPGDTSLARRAAIIAAWLDAATKLAERSKDPEALAVAIFLREHARLAVPMPNHGLAVTGELPVDKSRRGIYLVPMITDDMWRLPRGEYVLRYASYSGDRVGAFASFYPANRAIYLPGEWSLSELSKGLLLLHEGLHAYDRVIRQRRMPKPYWRREYNALELEARVFLGSGGSRIRRYIDSLQAEVRRQHTSSASGFTFVPPKDATSDSRLYPVLGCPTGPDDRALKLIAIRDAAVRLFFAQTLGATAARKTGQEYVRRNGHVPSS